MPSVSARWSSRSAASEINAGSSPPAMTSKKPAPGVIGRWWGRLLTGSGYDGQRLAEALIADRVRRAEVLGPQRDPVLLEHPPHLAQLRSGRAAIRQRLDLVQPGLLQVRDLVHQLPVAVDRPATLQLLPAYVDRGEVARV